MLCRAPTFALVSAALISLLAGQVARADHGCEAGCCPSYGCGGFDDSCCSHCEEDHYEEPCDLTLHNFFSAGWDERFEERSKDGRAARIRLFRTRQGFLEREFRMNYLFENNADGGEVDEHELEAELELPFHRRFMMELEGEYKWIDSRVADDRDGSLWKARALLQLVDTYNTAANIQFSVEPPSKGELDERRTTLGVVAAGFVDLGNRVGLQSFVGNDFFVGEATPDEVQNRLHYSVALTKTLDFEAPGVEHLTPFIEFYGRTDLDGANSGRTRFSVLPGVRWEVAREWWLAFGGEYSVTGPKPYDQIVHFSVIREIE